MKLLITFLFTFLLYSVFGQTITVKEYDQNGDPIATPISQKYITPGDTISLEISILETASNDFRNTPYSGGGGGSQNFRGLAIKTAPNAKIIEIIETFNEKSLEVAFAASNDIDGVNSTIINDDGGSNYYRLYSTFNSDSQDSIDEITFKYVHIVIPCELEPGSYFVTLDEVGDFITNAAFTETNILELVYDEPTVSISIDAPEVRDACFSSTVNLDVKVIDGISDCAQYTLFVNDVDEGQYLDSINYDFYYGDEVKVQILGGSGFSNTITIDKSYFQPLLLESTSHSNFPTLCPGEQVDFQIALTSCGPGKVDLYKVGEDEAIAKNVTTEFSYKFNEADEIYAILKYSINGESTNIQTNTFSVGEILSIGNRYNFLRTYVFPSTQKSIDLMELDYDTTYSEPFLGHRVIDSIPLV
jgi:hypothetical protein